MDLVAVRTRTSADQDTNLSRITAWLRLRKSRVGVMGRHLPWPLLQEPKHGKLFTRHDDILVANTI